MITLPSEPVLVEHVRQALDTIADRDRNDPIMDAAWFPAIAAEIATSLLPLGLHSYARGEPFPCSGKEWLFDFCSLIYDNDVPYDDRYMAQAAVVGEVEWSCRPGAIEQDFEKLMIADSLVCFFTFQQFSASDAASKIDHLAHIAAQRQGYTRLRGLTRPPIFLLSCWIDPERRFAHRVCS